MENPRYLIWMPYVTPLFDEFAMFMAFAAALRSADLSRQVGAVVGKSNEIISTGATIALSLVAGCIGLTTTKRRESTAITNWAGIILARLILIKRNRAKLFRTSSIH